MEQNIEINSIPFQNNKNKPVVFILGPTGVGKTKVSINLSKLLKGEIINSDAFSLYKGADILTTKATLAERNLIPHHMIDILDIHETGYKILDYIKECSQVIKSLLDEKKESIPIIVGGTNYYVQSLLFDKIDVDQVDQASLLDLEMENQGLTEEVIKNEEFHGEPSDLDHDMKLLIDKIHKIKIDSFKEIDDKSSLLDIDLFNKNLTNFLSSLPEEKVLQILKLVDHRYYTFLHKNDTRRIKNAIIYYFAYNKKKSEKISKEFLKLKYANSTIIFLNPVVKHSFYSRIESRVDEIINDNGLVEIFRILVEFYSIHGEDIENQFDKGILQAIGYKEFYPLFKKIIQIGKLKIKNSCDRGRDTQPILDTMESIQNLIADCELDSLFQECRKKHISNTIKYAKSQLKFIKNRILPYVNSKRVIEIKISEFTNEIYLDYINQSFKFIEKINENLHIENGQENFLNSQLCNMYEIKKQEENHLLEAIVLPLHEIQEKLNKISFWEKFNCEICKIEINGKYEYDSHIKSNKHKKKKRNEKIKLENKNNKSNILSQEG